MAAPRRGLTQGRRPSKKREYLDADERKRQLIAIGLVAFAEAPYDQVSIDAVAEAAGTSKGLLYHYFPTKRDFYAAVVGEAALRLLHATQTDPGLPVGERVLRGVDGYFKYVESHAQAYLAVMRGGLGMDPAIAAIVERTRQSILDAASEAFGGPLPPLFRTALRGWIGYVEALSLHWLERRDVPLEAVRDDAAAMFLAVLGRFPSVANVVSAPPPSPPSRSRAAERKAR